MQSIGEREMGLGGHLRQTARLAWPVVVGQLGHILIQVFDNAMIGNVGSKELAAATIANALFFLVIIVGIGMASVLTPLVSEARGNQNMKRVSALFHNGFYLYVIAGLVFALLTQVAAKLTPFLNQEEEVVPLAISYLSIISLSIPPMMMFLHYKHFMEGMMKVRTPMYAMAIMVVMNIFFNWVLIYGELGFPAYGLDGAGYATVIARTSGLLALVVLAARSKAIKPHVAVIGVGRLDPKIIKRLLSLGIPAGLQVLFEAGAFAGTALMVGWIGYREQAGHNIAVHLASITFSIAVGIASAASIRVGEFIGHADFKGARHAGFGAIALGVIVMATGGLIFLIFNRELPTFYNKEAYVIDVAAQLLIVAAIFQISDGVQAVASGALRGISDTKVPAIITFIAYWILALPIGFLLAFKFDFGVLGLWAGLVAGLTFAAILLTIRFALRISRQSGYLTNK